MISVNERQPRCTIVVGDGLGDLAMMLASDLPIVLQPGQSFRRVCERYSIQLRSLLDYVYGKTMPEQAEQAEQAEQVEQTGEVKGKEKKVIYVADSWSEIAGVLTYISAMRDDWFLPSTPSTQPSSPAVRCTAEQCRLMALTNDVLNEVGGEVMEQAILESIRGGATMVQIRDKTENFGMMMIDD